MSLDVINTAALLFPFPQGIKKIVMRGTIDVLNIFFSAADVEESLVITIPPRTPYVWMSTPGGREKYMSYSTLNHVLVHLETANSCRISSYLRWVDNILFARNQTKRCNLAIQMKQDSLAADTETSSNMSDDVLQDEIEYQEDDVASIADSDYQYDSKYTLQHKYDQLVHQLQLTQKDNEIIQHRLQVKEKEIELLQLRISLLSTNSVWI
jgi:hypothetical protein